MKRLILALLIMAWPLSAMAATLTCDPQAGVERYEFEALDGITTSTALLGGVMSTNLDTIPAGSYTIKARACQGTWCSEWSDPFVFVKPALAKPVGFTIKK